MKYIDAEKLIAKVKELNLATKTYEEQVTFNNALAMVVEIIDSLQQEQPEVEFNKELDSFYDSPLLEGATISFMSYTRIAQHFYELGLNAKEE